MSNDTNDSTLEDRLAGVEREAAELKTMLQALLGEDTATVVCELNEGNPGFGELIIVVCEAFIIANGAGLSTHGVTQIMDDHTNDVIDTAEAMARMTALVDELRDLSGVR